MAHTPNIGAILLEEAQAQKEVTVNEAFMRIDALLNNGALSIDFTAPPATPHPGDMYIVAENAAQAWQGKEHHITYFDQIWRFIEPKQGATLWVHDKQTFYYYNNSLWMPTDTINATEMLGINSTADTVNRLSVSSESILYTAEYHDVRTILNKKEASDTASIIFQNNFEGRAEFGLIGNDDFALKLSNDGVHFNTALTAQHDTGHIIIERQLEAPQSMYIYAEHFYTQSITPTRLNGCDVMRLRSFDTQGADMPCFAFAANVSQHAQTSWRIPASWSGGELKIILNWGHDSGTVAHTVWQAELAVQREGLPLSQPYNLSSRIVSSANTDIYAHKTDMIFDGASLQSGDMIYIRIGRLGQDIDDTLNDNAYLFGLQLECNVRGLHRN